MGEHCSNVAKLSVTLVKYVFFTALGYPFFDCDVPQKWHKGCWRTKTVIKANHRQSKPKKWQKITGETDEEREQWQASRPQCFATPSSGWSMFGSMATTFVSDGVVDKLVEVKVTRQSSKSSQTPECSQSSLWSDDKTSKVFLFSVLCTCACKHVS